MIKLEGVSIIDSKDIIKWRINEPVVFLQLSHHFINWQKDILKIDVIHDKWMRTITVYNNNTMF